MIIYLKNDHEGNSESSINCKIVTKSNNHLSLASGSDGNGRHNNNNNITLDTSKEEPEDDDDDFIPRVIADLSCNSLEHQLANWLSNTESHILVRYFKKIQILVILTIIIAMIIMMTVT